MNLKVNVNIGKLVSHKTTIAMLFIHFFLVPLSVSATDNNNFYAHVTKVIDGDTVKILHRNKNITVRFWGIDTPEWDQPFANNAKSYTKKILKKKKVEIKPHYYDDYGRLVAQIFLNGENVNQQLVKEGYAWVHVYYCKEYICKKWKKYQKKAKNDGLGLWGVGDNIPPWEWKRKGAGKRQ